jgi:hypothetical protein
MAEGFVQVAVDGAGKQIDNDVITVPAGTIITDTAGVQTVLAAPAWYYRQRTVHADPTDPLGVGAVVRTSPGAGTYGQVTREAPGSPDLEDIKQILRDTQDMLAQVFGFVGPQSVPPNVAMPATMLPGARVSGVPINLICDKFGRQVVVPGTIRDLVAPATLTLTSSTTETTLITKGPSDTFNDLVALVIANTSATAVRVDIRDATAGTVTIPVYVPAGDMRGLALGGITIPQTAPGNNWTAQCSASVADVRIWALYAKNK